MLIPPAAHRRHTHPQPPIGPVAFGPTVAALCVPPAAEAQLKNNEHLPGFPLVVLKVVELPMTPPQLRLAASVLFKNFVKVGLRALPASPSCRPPLLCMCHHALRAGVPPPAAAMGHRGRRGGAGDRR